MDFFRCRLDKTLFSFRFWGSALVKELLGNRIIFFLWLGQAASALGSTFATFILSWLLYDITGSKAAMGGLWVAFMIPNLLMQLYSGPYVDRKDRRNIMLYSEWLRVAAFLFLISMTLLESLEVWHLYVTVVAIGIAEPFFRLSCMAYIANILPKEQLFKGNSLFEGTMQFMMLIGPVTGGLLIQWFKAESLLILLVIILGLSGALLFFIPRSQSVLHKKDDSSWLKQLSKGIAFYRIDPVLFWFSLLITVVNIGNGATMPMYLPYVSDVFGGTSVHYGLFTSSLYLGMILGSVWSAIRKELRDIRKVMLGVLTIQGVFLLLLGGVHHFLLSLFLIVGYGFCAVLSNIYSTTLYQKRVPDHLRGRVFAIQKLLAQLGLPIGAAVGGGLAEVWGISVLFALLGGFVMIVMGVAWISPIFRNLNRFPVEEKNEFY
jgi:MFS family permease